MEIDKTKLILKDKSHNSCYKGLLYYDSKLIGYATGYGTDSKIFHSTYIFINHDFRGNGLGNFLKEKQIEYAKKKGYKTLTTIIGSSNIPSIKMQEHFGCNIKSYGDICTSNLCLK